MKIIVKNQHISSLVPEKHLNLVDNTIAFNKMLAGIGVEETRGRGLDFFNLDQAKLISQYFYAR